MYGNLISEATLSQAFSYVLRLERAKGIDINMIRFSDIVNIEKKDYDNYKIHFARMDDCSEKNHKDPLQEFYRGTFEAWQAEQSARNFKENSFIISLIQYYSKVEWLFAGIYKVVKLEKKDENENYPYIYTTELTDLQKDYIGRIVIKYHNTERQAYRFLISPDKTDIYKELIIDQILKKKATIEKFPGYNNVNISYDDLKSIIDNNETSWKDALSIMKGIYLIIDKTNGMKYVGSATGTDAIWDRWSSYAKNGHGENKKLKELIDKYGKNYAENFRYTILEIFDINSNTNDIILNRENFWKSVLMTRQFGYNQN